MTTAYDLLASIITNAKSISDKNTIYNQPTWRRSKSNLGWTPLHLATYFGHQAVVELLLSAGADVNVVNDAGDTALHKAAFIGREDLVLLLLKFNASVNVSNAEGQLPQDVAKPGSDILKILSAAQAADAKKREQRLLNAARENDLETINALLKDPDPPNINCTDALGNTPLHCAAYRGHKQVAILLLENGVDSSVRNSRGQLAMDLTRDPQMQQVLNLKPVRVLQKTAERFEGQLLKRSRFLGWKPVWTVLERGVLTYYNSRGDGTSGTKRRDFKYLDGARVLPLEHDSCTFVIHFSDSGVHRLSVVEVKEGGGGVERQRWINALNEHIAYNNHYLRQGQALSDSDEDDDCAVSDMKPLGSMKDSLQTATAHSQTLEKKVREVEMIVKAMGSDSFPHNEAVLQMALSRYKEVSEHANEMVSSLNHCLTLLYQQQQLRDIQLKQEQEKCRVLEEALNVLAKEHHELEQSLASGGPKSRPRTPRFYDTDDDEFYDAFDADSDDDTLVTAAPSEGAGGSPMGSLHSALSRTSSATTLRDYSYRSAVDTPPIMQNSAWDRPSRTSLPVPMFSRNDFSIWSVLKNCIGKELSKITMPVIFNEPLSFLQRMSEYMEYAHLLSEASKQEDPVHRMKYVAAFAVSALASNWERLGKPFNPLLGETFELQRPGYRIICEQVSHHPPVSAFHADSKDFIFHGSIHPKLKFWGKSVEIQPKGVVTVELPRWGEAYTWTNVNCCVHNIIVGKLWIEQYGSMEINSTNGHKCFLNFKPAGWFSKDLHRVEGFVTDPKKNKLLFLYGKWTEFIRSTDYASFDDYYKDNSEKFRRGTEKEGSQTPKKVLAKLSNLKMGVSFSKSQAAATEEGGPPEPADDFPKSSSSYSIDIPNSETLWSCVSRPENCAEFYQFTYFAMGLNEMDDNLKKILCPTDSRLRPDIRMLECGDIDGAALEKTRLEEKQRDVRKARKGKKAEEVGCRWFTQGANPHTKADDWLYSGGYWDRNYADITDIF